MVPRKSPRKHLDRAADSTDHRCLSALLAVEDGQVIDRALDWLAIAFWDEKGNRDQHVPDDAVLAITEQLAIDLDAAWPRRPWART